MDKQKVKSNGIIHYDNAFKQDAISIIVNQLCQSQELQVSTYSLRTWLKNADLNPKSENKYSS